MFEIDSALRTLVERGGSDLHVKVAAPPMIRLHGELTPLEGYQPLSEEDTEKAFHDIAEVRSLTEFEEEGEADFSYAIHGLSRFRVNTFKQRGSTSIVCRAIPFEIRSVEELGLPPVVTHLAEEQRGIILVTGTTGSGKSTTLAAMIDHINRSRAHHIVTLEDPIEYLHEDKGSIVNQREVGADTGSFARAMRRVLRQDPDVILIGEMRDEVAGLGGGESCAHGLLVARHLVLGDVRRPARVSEQPRELAPLREHLGEHGDVLGERAVRALEVQPAAQVGGVRRSDEDQDRLRHRRAHLSRALNLDLQDHRETLPEPPVDRLPERSVEVAAVGRVLQEVARGHALVELLRGEEVVVAPVLLAGPRRARGRRHRQLEPGHALQQLGDQRPLAHPRRARDDKDFRHCCFGARTLRAGPD